MNINIKTTFLGYAMTKCDISRKINELPEKIKVQLTNINLNSDDEKLSIDYLVGFTHDDGHESTICYQAWFNVFDNDLKSDFEIAAKDSKHKISDDNINKIVPLVQVSFPYIRESVCRITNDMSGAIMIPVFDASVLINGGLEFSREPIKEKDVKKNEANSKHGHTEKDV